jgi:hypothetical protein
MSEFDSCPVSWPFFPISLGSHVTRLLEGSCWYKRLPSLKRFTVHRFNCVDQHNHARAIATWTQLLQERGAELILI